MSPRALLGRVRVWRARRRASRPERLRRRAEADARRIEAKRNAWTDAGGGGG
jgi:hypothetical protein